MGDFGSKSGKQDFPPAEQTAEVLTEDALIHIFEYLPFRDRFLAGMVCKVWHRAVARTWSSTKKMDFKIESWSGNGTLPTTDLISKVLEKCGRFLRVVEIGNFGDKTTPTLVLEAFNANSHYKYTMPGHEKHLEKLKIFPAWASYKEHSFIPLDIFNTLASHCSNLIKISVYSNDPREPDMENLFLANPGLKSFEFHTFPFNITWKCLLPLPESLESLTLHLVKQSGPNSRIWLREQNLTQVLSNLSNLKNLTLYSHEVVASMMESAQKLKYLETCALYDGESDWYDGDRYTPQARTSRLFPRAAPQFVNIRSLSLSSNTISDAYLRTISQHCKSLESLFLAYANHHVTDIGLIHVLSISSLKYLRLLQLDIRFAGYFPSSHNLVQLDCEECYEVDANQLFWFIHNSETLMVVNIDECFPLTAYGLWKFEKELPSSASRELKVTVTGWFCERCENNLEVPYCSCQSDDDDLEWNVGLDYEE